MQSTKKTSKFDYSASNFLNTRRCGARTRRGTSCLGPAVKGKKRCRMHGAFAGRPKDPLVQMFLYNKMLYRHINKFCINCESMNIDCRKIFIGETLPENFQDRLKKYCFVNIRDKKVHWAFELKRTGHLRPATHQREDLENNLYTGIFSGDLKKRILQYALMYDPSQNDVYMYYFLLWTHILIISSIVFYVEFDLGPNTWFGRIERRVKMT